MRWQPLSVSETFAAGDWPGAARRHVPPLAVATLMATAALLLLPPSTPAEADEIVVGGDVLDVGEGGTGMPASNPRVRSLLATYPGEFVTICVAGCAGKPSIVQVLPRPVERRSAEMVPTAGGRGPSGHAAEGFYTNDVTCMAGCGGPSGKVLQRMSGLPAPGKAPKAAAKEAGNEPLDIGR